MRAHDLLSFDTSTQSKDSGPGMSKHYASWLLAFCIGCTAPTGDDTDVRARTIALVEGKVFSTASPDQLGTTVQWVIVGGDTSLSRPTAELAFSTLSTTFAARTRAFYVGFGLSTSQFVTYDMTTRKQLGRVVLSAPIEVKDAVKQDRHWRVRITQNNGVLALDSLRIVLLSARVEGVEEFGVLAIDLESLKPIWFLRGRDPIAFAAVSGTGGREAWVSVRHSSGLFGQSGSLLRIDMSTFVVADSALIPARGDLESYAFNLSNIPGTTPTVFAVTTGAIFRCTGTPLRCAPTAIPGSGVLTTADEKSNRWLQLVSNDRRRAVGPPALRVIRADGVAERTIDSPRLARYFDAGISGSILDDGNHAVLLFGANRLYAPIGERGSVAIVNLNSGVVEWERQLATDAIAPSNSLSR